MRVKQILAELAFLDQRREIAVRGADHPDIDPLQLLHTDCLDLASLQHTQEFCLTGERQIADLVEKNRAALGLHEFARMVPARRR